MSRDILQRAKLEQMIEVIPANEIYELSGIDKHRYKFKQRIEPTWQLHNSTKSHCMKFLVAEEAHFDLLLGNDFIQAQNILKPDRSLFFLGLRRRNTGKRPVYFPMKPKQCSFSTK